MSSRLNIWSLCLLASLIPLSAQQLAKTDPTLRPEIVESYGKLPLSFEANQGQTNASVKFLARGSGYTLFLAGDSSAVFSLHGKTSKAALRMKPLGANAHAAVAGADALPGKSNYFIGSDPAKWHTNVPTYGSVKYTGVYRGIDLVYHGSQRLLEYDFVVAPGADPKAIDLRFQGARKLTVNRDGALVLAIGDSEVIEHAPVVYQEIGGRRETVAGRYVLRGKDRVGFRVAQYDHSQPLVIDPILVYSTFLGGNGDDIAYRIAVDRLGNAYVIENSAGAFVYKLNPAGSALVYSTFLGGGSGYSIALDADSNAYVAGTTDSADFPITPGAFQTNLGSVGTAAFVAKLNANGSLVYSSHFGSDVNTLVNLAVDASGNAYITGGAGSGFPTTPGALDTTSGGAFVTKLNAAGSALLYSTFLGGPESSGSGIAVDALGSAYVTGDAGFAFFPTTPGAFQTTRAVGMNGFITKLNATGSALVYSTYLGGWTFRINAIAIDLLGNAYVAGQASHILFPTTPGAFQTTFAGGNGDAFVTKLNSIGSALVYSTYLGGNGDDQALDLAVDSAGNAYVTGYAGPNFPTTSNAIQTTLAGYRSGFVTKLNASGSAITYSTYLNGVDGASGTAVDGEGNVYISGLAYSDFTATPGAFQTTFGGGNYDGFVAKLSPGNEASNPVTTANIGGSIGNYGWYISPVTVTLNATVVSTPVLATYYSLDSAGTQTYTGPFPISSDGVHQLSFYSVDTAGHQEPPHGQIVRIDTKPPVSHVLALPATATSPNFRVQWSGTDATSQVFNYTIYVSDNGGPYTPWQSQTAAYQAWFVGYLGHTYAFYSIAGDNAGNQEIPKTVAEAATQTPVQMAADVNGDGKIDCADLAIVKGSLTKTPGQPGYDPRADVNHDGVINVIDLALVSQKLIPGTTCP